MKGICMKGIKGMGIKSIEKKALYNTWYKTDSLERWEKRYKRS